MHKYLILIFLSSTADFSELYATKGCRPISDRRVALDITRRMVKNQCGWPACGVFAANAIFEKEIFAAFGIETQLSDGFTFANHLTLLTKQLTMSIESNADLDKIIPLFSSDGERDSTKTYIEEGADFAQFLAVINGVGAVPDENFKIDFFNNEAVRTEFVYALFSILRKLGDGLESLRKVNPSNARYYSENHQRLRSGAVEEIEHHYHAFMSKALDLDANGRFLFQQKKFTPLEFMRHFLFQGGKIRVNGTQLNFTYNFRRRYEQIFNQNNLYGGAIIGQGHPPAPYTSEINLLTKDIPRPTTTDSLTAVCERILGRGKTIYLVLKWREGIEKTNLVGSEYHAVELVKIYRRPNRAIFIIRNSWGPEWIDRGYAEVDANEAFENFRYAVYLETI